MKATRTALRLLLSLTFAFAAVVKILDPKSFFEAVQTYHLLGRIPAGVVAVWLPCLELVLAAALWFPKFARVSSGMLAVLCGVFLVALVQAWVRGIDITCGCFGRPDPVAGTAYIQYVARDVGLLAVAVALRLMDAKAAPDESGAAC